MNPLTFITYESALDYLESHVFEGESGLQIYTLLSGKRFEAYQYIIVSENGILRENGSFL